MDIPTLMPTILKIMVAAVSTITVILMAILVIKIYRGEARNENIETGSEDQ